MQNKSSSQVSLLLESSYIGFFTALHYSYCRNVNQLHGINIPCSPQSNSDLLVISNHCTKVLKYLYTHLTYSPKSRSMVLVSELLYKMKNNWKNWLITDHISMGGNAITSVCLTSICFQSIFRTNWPLILNFCTWVGHDHSSQGIEGQGHR